MNNNDLTGLLNLAYEIEGLLMLHINRGDEADPRMATLLREKAARLCRGLDASFPEPGFAAVAAASCVRTDEAASMAAVAASAEREESEDADIAAPMQETAQKSAPDLAPAAPPTIGDTAPAPERLDEKLTRASAADISKAFTLNDRFRFRRDLFRGSDADFKDTLDIISRMNSMEEAEEYFYNDLCWEPTDPDVKEFMEIVGRHF